MALLKSFQWNYASFVHSDSEYGTTGYQLVKAAVEKTREICLADPITIYNQQFESKDYENVVKRLVHGNHNDTTANDHKDNSFVKPQVVIGKLIFWFHEKKTK